MAREVPKRPTPDHDAGASERDRIEAARNTAESLRLGLNGQVESVEERLLGYLDDSDDPRLIEVARRQVADLRAAADRLADALPDAPGAPEVLGGDLDDLLIAEPRDADQDQRTYIESDPQQDGETVEAEENPEARINFALDELREIFFKVHGLIADPEITPAKKRDLDLLFRGAVAARRRIDISPNAPAKEAALRQADHFIEQLQLCKDTVYEPNSPQFVENQAVLVWYLFYEAEGLIFDSKSDIDDRLKHWLDKCVEYAEAASDRVANSSEYRAGKELHQDQINDDIERLNFLRELADHPQVIVSQRQLRELVREASTVALGHGIVLDYNLIDDLRGLHNQALDLIASLDSEPDGSVKTAALSQAYRAAEYIDALMEKRQTEISKKLESFSDTLGAIKLRIEIGENASEQEGLKEDLEEIKAQLKDITPLLRSRNTALYERYRETILKLTFLSGLYPEAPRDYMGQVESSESVRGKLDSRLQEAKGLLGKGEIDTAGRLVEMVIPDMLLDLQVALAGEANEQKILESYRAKLSQLESDIESAGYEAELRELRSLSDAGSDLLLGRPMPDDIPQTPDAAFRHYLKNANEIVKRLQRVAKSQARDRALGEANILLENLANDQKMFAYPKILFGLRRMQELYQGGLFLFGPRARHDEHVVKMADRYCQEAEGIYSRLRADLEDYVVANDSDAVRSYQIALDQVELMKHHLNELKDGIKTYEVHPGLSEKFARQFDETWRSTSPDSKADIWGVEFAIKRFDSHWREADQHRSSGDEDTFRYYLDRVLPDDLKQLLAREADDSKRQGLQVEYQAKIEELRSRLKQTS